jgi:predicted dehydrogenase
MDQRKVRWGILSTARIGTQKVIPAMQDVTTAAVVAIASRTASRAERAAEQLGIDRAFSSYDELLQCEDVDAIYIPLPNHLHVEWAVRCLQAGKHVLCEKPIGLNRTDAERLLDAASQFPQLKVMEAFMYRHHPQWIKVRELVDAGELGDLRALQFAFCYRNTDANDIRNRTDAGGGGLMDIGCYPISVARWLFASQPQRVVGLFEIAADLGTDILTAGMLEFDTGLASFTCSTQLPRYQGAQILGTAGRLELPWPFNPDPAEPATVFHQPDGEEVRTIRIVQCNQYGLQVERMNEAILNDLSVPTPLEDALENMQVIDAMVASRDTGGWVTLK